jgi:hypothetical protein
MMDSMHKTIEETISGLATVFGDFTSSDEIATSDVAEAEKRLNRELPDALKKIYIRTGRHPLHRAHNILVSPSNLEIINESYLVFYKENQGVSSWAVNVSDSSVIPSDPSVFTSTKDCGVSSFVQEFETISAYLSFQAAWQAVNGALPNVGTIEVCLDDVEQRPMKITSDVASRIGNRLASTRFAEVWYGKGLILIFSLDGFIGLATMDENTFLKAAAEIGIEEEQWDFASPRDDL